MILNKPIKRFVDTNILVYSMDLSLENRSKHRACLEILRPNPQEILCLSSQILAEFYAVVTSSKSVANPIGYEEAKARVIRFYQMPNLQILQLPEDILPRWLNLLTQHPVKGANVFDLIHLATMISQGVTSIYTFNDEDFNWCQDIDVIVPII
jgi:predicted nucleic acid-binding protein